MSMARGDATSSRGLLPQAARKQLNINATAEYLGHILATKWATPLVGCSEQAPEQGVVIASHPSFDS
jgi:hypothetical protein